jgi:hypothetical protein
MIRNPARKQSGPIKRYPSKAARRYAPGQRDTREKQAENLRERDGARKG